MITLVTEPKTWQGIFNEILFEFQRKDFNVTLIDANYITLNSVTGLEVGDNIYIDVTEKQVFAEILAISGSAINTDVEFTDAGEQGFVNCETIDGEDKFWSLEIEINGYGVKQINSDIYGSCSTDISKNLKNLFSIVNTDDYSVKIREDSNLSAEYVIIANEIAQNEEISTLDVGTYYALFSCLAYSDLTDYYMDYGSAGCGKFLTEFTELKFWGGENFDVGVIMDVHESAIMNVKEELHFYDGTSETNAYTLSAYNNKLVRIGLAGSYTNVKYINLGIFEGDSAMEACEVIKINVESDSCNGLNIHWINAFGVLDNWVFEHNQVYSVTTKANPIIFDSKELDLSKTANEEITVFLENEDQKYLSGLQFLLYSPQLFIDGDAVRIKTGTFKIYETSKDMFNLSFVLIKNHLNLAHL